MDRQKQRRKQAELLQKVVVNVVVEDDKKAAVVEVNSETDFVAKEREVPGYVAEALQSRLLTTDAADMDAFMEEKWHEDRS